MNNIFTAKRDKIPIDSCIIIKNDSNFLQQASNMTNGIYFNLYDQSLINKDQPKRLLKDVDLLKRVLLIKIIIKWIIILYNIYYNIITVIFTTYYFKR